VQLDIASRPLALLLFGAQGLASNDINSPFFKPGVKYFLDFIWTRTLSRYKQRLDKRVKRSKAKLIQLEQEWTSKSFWDPTPGC
jgi:hypothetical protein